MSALRDFLLRVRAWFASAGMRLTIGAVLGIIVGLLYAWLRR